GLSKQRGCWRGDGRKRRGSCIKSGAIDRSKAEQRPQSCCCRDLPAVVDRVPFVALGCSARRGIDHHMDTTPGCNADSYAVERTHRFHAALITAHWSWEREGTAYCQCTLRA